MAEIVMSQKQLRHDLSVNWLLAGPLYIKDLCTIVIDYMNGIEGNCLFKLRRHNRLITALAVLPNNMIVSSSYDNTIHVWNGTNGDHLFILDKHNGWTNTLVVLPDCQIASGSNDHIVRIWDVVNKKCIIKLKGHSDWISSLAMLSDQKLVSGSYDNTMRIWNYVSGECLMAFPGLVDTLVSLSNGNIAYSSFNSMIYMHDMKNRVDLLKLDSKGGETIRALVSLPNDKLILSYDSIIYIWDTLNNKCLQTFKGHENSVIALVDNLLASGSFDKTVRIWDIERGLCLLTIYHTSIVRALAVLPDGRLVSGCDNMISYVWD